MASEAFLIENKKFQLQNITQVRIESWTSPFWAGLAEVTW